MLKPDFAEILLDQLNNDIGFAFSVSPTIVHSPQNVTVDEAGRKDVTLFCNATSRPAAVISWVRVKDGSTLTSGNVLTIQAADRSHRGRYSCVANNGVGHSASKSAYLDVHCMLNIVYFNFVVLFLFVQTFVPLYIKYKILRFGDEVIESLSVFSV